MVTELGYCNFCEKQSIVYQDHHCSVCYEQYCEKCYYENLYENDMCKKCMDDLQNCDSENTNSEYESDCESNDTVIAYKNNLKRLNEIVNELQLQNQKFKTNQCLLIALETIDLRDDIKRDDIIDIKDTIKQLLYNNSANVTDNDADLYKTIIEELSGLKITCKTTDSYYVNFSVFC